MTDAQVDSTADAPVLHPLHCPFCGGEVSFGPTETVPCANCGEAVPIPEEHRRAAQAARERDEKSARAAKTWSGISSGGTPRPLLLVIKLMALGAGVSVLFPGVFLMAAAPDNERYFVPFLIWFAAVEAVFILYAALVVQSTSRSVASASFWGALGGKPVEGKPGAYRCRSCGAMLNVPAGAVAVSCAYCGRDNLVGMPPERLRSMMGEARHSTLSLEAASKTIKFRKDERFLYFTTQFLLAQLVLLPMLARGLDGELDLGLAGAGIAFGVAFVALMVFGFAISMRKINAHLKDALEIWKANDKKSEAFLIGDDYMLAVIGDAGLLLDSPMSKAFVPAGAVTRARFASMQFDIAWKEGGASNKASFHSQGDKSRILRWVEETSGGAEIKRLDGDSVSVARAVFNGVMAIGILAWIAGMIFL